jgi:hypothetical protein
VRRHHLDHDDDPQHDHRAAERDDAERRTRSGAAGNVTLVVAALLAVTGLLALGTARLGAAAVARARVEAAADAAALAGAADGAEAARRVAAANDATVTAFRQVGDDVVVTVRRGRMSATARARWEPSAPAEVTDRAGAPARDTGP